MPKKSKPEPKPLFEVKHDFLDSLEAFLGETLKFLQAVETAIDLGEMKPNVKEMLRERADAFRKRLLTDL